MPRCSPELLHLATIAFPLRRIAGALGRAAASHER